MLDETLAAQDGPRKRGGVPRFKIQIITWYYSRGRRGPGVAVDPGSKPLLVAGEVATPLGGWLASLTHLAHEYEGELRREETRDSAEGDDAA